MVKKNEDKQIMSVGVTIMLNFNEGELNITLVNIPLDILALIGEDSSLESIAEYQYYLNTVYDKIQLLGLKFIITRKTKSAITLLHI